MHSEYTPLSCQKTLLNGNPRGNPAKAPRCGAKTRAGNPCKAPAVKGKQRCRMHGGTKGSGAPKENQNALKHGHYSLKSQLERNYIRELINLGSKAFDSGH